MNHKKIKRWACGVALCSAAPYLNAQVIEEMVVTAQKREQSLQEAPIALTAFDAELMDKLDVRDLSMLNGLAPNLKMAASPGNSNGVTINIRGSVTVNNALTLEPTVGVYLDGIYIGKNIGGLFDVADLERIEVLRGPQGTLYGKNTLGGAINVITRRPSGELQGSVKISYGSEQLRSVKFGLHTPALGEVGEGLGRVSAQLAYIQTQRDGFIRNRADDLPGSAAGADFDNLDRRSGRVALRWMPRDAIDINYAYDFSRIDQRPQLYQLTRLDRALVDTYTQLTGLPAYDLTPYVSNRRVAAASADNASRDNADVDGHALEISWDAGDRGVLGDVTLKSLSGYRELEASARVDWDGSPYALMATGRDVRYRSFSQELQWLGETERTSYVFGLYYFRESGRTTDPLDLTLFPLQVAPAVFIPTPRIISQYGLANRAAALFTQVEWMPPVLDDRLRLTIGARYSQEDKSIKRFYAIPSFGAVLVDNAEFDKDYTDFAPTAVLSYQPTSAVNIYAKVARGWKAGVFNAESSDPAELDSPIAPESVTSYEVGVKSRWLGERLQLNVAGFYDKHTDLQISRFRQADAQSVFSNAGKADIRGVELEAIAMPLEGLVLTLSYGYTDANYRQYIDECRITASGANPCPAGVAPGALYDAKDVNRFPYTPENAGSVAVEYRVPLAIGALTARADWSFTDGYAVYADPYNYENTSVGHYELLDLRLVWGGIGLGERAQLSLSAWCRNATDTEYKVNGIEWGAFTTERFGDPRSLGVDVAVTF